MVEVITDEALLIEKAAQKDAQAFSALVRIHQEKILRAAFSFVGNREDAREIAQEAFVKAYDALPGFKGGSRFSTWLYRILANQCKDFLRKKTVRRNLAVTLRPVEDGEEDQRPEDQIPSRRPDALNDLLSKEMGEAVRAAMEDLPFQQRSVFAFRYLEGLSLQEIAGAMNLSEGAVKAHLWQAVQKMQKPLAVFLK